MAVLYQNDRWNRERQGNMWDHEERIGQMEPGETGWRLDTWDKTVRTQYGQVAVQMGYMLEH